MTTRIVALVVVLTLSTQVGCNKHSSEKEPSDGSSSDTFQKPELSDDSECELLLESNGPIGALDQTGVCPRPYLRPQDALTNVWAFNDESVVFDLSVQVNPDVLDQYVSSGVYHFYVLVDFKAVPFGFVKANPESGFASREDLNQLEGYTERSTLDLKDDKLATYSVIIPPESFPGEKAHDVRFLWLSKESSPASPTRTRGSHRISRYVRVNHGGTSFDNDMRELDAELVRPPDELLGLATKQSILLYPSYEIYNPQEVSNWTDLRYGQTFESSDTTTTIHGLVPATDIGESTDLYLLTLKDGDFLENGPQGHFTLPKAPEGGSDPGKSSARFSFESELSADSTSKFQAIYFRNPFQKGLNAVVDSNTLFLKAQSE